MKPYYDEAGITIYHGDALEILPVIGAAAAVVTDPPYLLGGASTRRGERTQSPVADWTNASRWYRDWLALAFQMTGESGAVWSFGNWRTVPVIEMAAQSLARRVTSTLVWDKQWIGVGSMNGLRCSYELVFLLGGADYKIADRTVADVWREKWASSRPSGHAQEKPVGLMRRILNLCPHGTVTDPFMGSGTTLVAAKESGRNAVGIEIEERYCEIAATRLSQQAMALSAPPAPEGTDG